MIEIDDAIVFDFDGVIIDSADIKNKCFKNLYKNYGIEEKVDVTKGGKSRYEKIRYFHKKLLNLDLNKEEVEKIANEYSKLLKEPMQRCPLVKGAEEYILKNYGKKDMYILSGTPYGELISLIKNRNLTKYFKGIYDSRIPKSDTLKNISKKYKKIVYFGDQLTDYKAAKESKIPFIGIVPKDKDSPFPVETSIINNFSILL